MANCERLPRIECTCVRRAPPCTPAAARNPFPSAGLVRASLTGSCARVRAVSARVRVSVCARVYVRCRGCLYVASARAGGRLRRPDLPVCDGACMTFFFFSCFSFSPFFLFFFCPLFPSLQSRLCCLAVAPCGGLCGASGTSCCDHLHEAAACADADDMALPRQIKTPSPEVQRSRRALNRRRACAL